MLRIWLLVYLQYLVPFDIIHWKLKVLYQQGRMILAHLCDEHKGLKTGMCMVYTFIRTNDIMLLEFCIFKSHSTGLCYLLFFSSVCLFECVSSCKCSCSLPSCPMTVWSVVGSHPASKFCSLLFCVNETLTSCFLGILSKYNK